MPITYQSQQLPPDIEANLKAMMDRSRAIASAPHIRYAGQRVAPLPLELRRAAELAQREGQYLPAFNQAESLLQNIAALNYPEHAERYVNPYRRKYLQDIEENALRTFTDKILPEIENKFVRLGQHGGSRHRQLTSKMTSQFHKDLLEAKNNALAHAHDISTNQFNADKARQLMSAKELASLGLMRQAGQIADIGALEQMGGHKHRLGQLSNDIDYQNYLHELSRPIENMNMWSSVMHGIPYSMATQAFNNPLAAPPQMNAAANIGNIAGSLLGLRQGMQQQSPLPFQPAIVPSASVQAAHNAAPIHRPAPFVQQLVSAPSPPQGARASFLNQHQRPRTHHGLQFDPRMASPEGPYR